MNDRGLRPEQHPVADVLRRRLNAGETCPDVIDCCEALLRSIFAFVARLLGTGGARAVVARSIQVATRQASLLSSVRVREDGPDLAELRERLARADHDPSEVEGALIRLGLQIFQTLSDLTGDAVTVPLLRHLEEEERSREQW